MDGARVRQQMIFNTASYVLARKKKKKPQHAGKWTTGSVVLVFYVGHLAQSLYSQQFSVVAMNSDHQ